MALFVEQVIDETLCRAAWDGRNDGRLAGGQERLDHTGVGVVGLVGQQDVGLQVGQEGVGAQQVMGLAWRQ